MRNTCANFRNELLRHAAEGLDIMACHEEAGECKR